MSLLYRLSWPQRCQCSDD